MKVKCSKAWVHRTRTDTYLMMMCKECLDAYMLNKTQPSKPTLPSLYNLLFGIGHIF